MFSGPDFCFRYPDGNALYSVIALYLAANVHGSLCISDGESLALRYFGLQELPQPQS